MFLLEEETTDDQDSTAADADKPTLTVDAEIAPPRPDIFAEAMLAIDLILPDKVVNIMATDLVAGTYASPILNMKGDRDFYRTGMETLFPAGPQRAAAIASVEGDMFNLPREINEHTFVLPKMKFKWSHDYQSFVSTENMSALGSVRGNAVGKLVEVQMEIKMPARGDDRLYMYVKSPSELYYFFGFKDGVLNVTSNNTMFMNELEDTRARELIQEMEDGETYEILPVSPATAETFLRRMRSAF